MSRIHILLFLALSLCLTITIIGYILQQRQINGVIRTQVVILKAVDGLQKLHLAEANNQPEAEKSKQTEAFADK